MRYILLFIAFFIVVACSKPSDKYDGYWEMESRTDTIMKLSKLDANTFIVNQNILGDYQDRALALNSSGNLELGGPFGSVIFILSEDGNTIRLDNKIYRRVNTKEAQKAEENSKACQKLADEYSDKYSVFRFKYGAEFDEPKRVLKEEYKELQKDITNCNLSDRILFF